MSNKKRKRAPLTEQKFFMTTEFRDEQNKWYEKLKSKGFEDLEYLDRSTGFGQNSDFLKRNRYRDLQKIEQNKYQFFRILGLFLNSEAFYVQILPSTPLNSNILKKLQDLNDKTPEKLSILNTDRFDTIPTALHPRYRNITQLLVDGYSYRQIVKILNKSRNKFRTKGKKWTLTMVYEWANVIKDRAMLWYEISDIDEEEELTFNSLIGL